MKKSIVAVLFVLFSIFTVYSQEENIESEDAELLALTDDSDDFDEFDSIFENAEDVDEALVEEPEEKKNTPIQVIASAFSSMVRFSGNFTADAGLVYMHNNGDNFSGALTVKNTLYMTVSPASFFSVRGSFYTGYDNGFALTVPEFYFDYFLLNRIFISAGKRGVSISDYTRLFCDSSYYGCGMHSGCLYSTGPLFTSISAGDGSPLCVDIRYPWATGTLTFATTGSFNGQIDPNSFNYYGSLEFSVLNTSINLFARKPQKAKDAPHSLIGGIEAKRTILGFDTYVQGIIRANNIKLITSRTGYDYGVATVGIYRLWDGFDPNIGFNIEYQFEYSPNADIKMQHRLAFEGGLKRIGKSKNMKIGVISHFNISELHGFSGLTFNVSGLIPYADWSTKAAVGYGRKYSGPVFMMSTGLSLALDY